MEKFDKSKDFDKYRDIQRSSVDGDNDEDDSSINSDEDVAGEKYDWMNNPFSIIDENANLDEVLNAKTIGEAMQVLCPNIPGK
jgi:hypothetical protein